ncbi:MAG: chemotaxis protein CheW [Marinagarivorans sp.]|nr:chemotaxis protein CheW [Marinagarivorans sp.]
MASAKEPQDSVRYDNDGAMKDYVASFFDGIDCDAAIAAIVYDKKADDKKADDKKAGGKSSPKNTANKNKTRRAYKKIVAEIQAPATVVPVIVAPVIVASLEASLDLMAAPSINKNLFEKQQPQYALPTIKANPYKPPTFLLAENIPADSPLNSVQKEGLQKLLDASIAKNLAKNSLEPEIPALTIEDSNSASINLDVVQTSSVLSAAPTSSLIKIMAEDGEQNVAPAEIIKPLDFRAHWHNQRPDWAAQHFDVLMFSCRGVTLAIPLISLGHIYWQTESLNFLPHLPDWVLGVKPQPQNSLKIIDAGAYFFPARPATLCTQSPMHLITFADSDWAFAVDTVANPLRIALDDVQWRGLSGENPWLAGAIKKPMCVVIDTPALLLHLDTPFSSASKR